MTTFDLAKLNTIRGRLWAGFGVLVLLLIMAGVVGKRSLAGMSATISESLAEVQTSSRLSSQLAGDVAQDHRSGRPLRRDARHRGADCIPKIRLGRARSAA